jgi:DNA-binding NtrC family response regulator
VLLVDDEPSVRRAIARLVRGAGYDVVEAGDGASAREAFTAGERFDLLLTDAVMPSTDTDAMIRAFSERCPDAPVVVCSGYVREDLVQHGIAAGDYDFIAKPFDPDELTELLHDVLARSRKAGRTQPRGRNA